MAIAAINGITVKKAVVVAIFGFGGAFLGLAGVKAVRFACLGRPLFMASLTVLPSASLAVSTFIVGQFSTGSAVMDYIPATCWASACILVWGVVAKRPLGTPQTVVSFNDESPRSQRLHLASLIVGLVGNTIYPSLFLGALSSLPGGGTTVLFLISRIGTSIVGLFVNSILTVRYNWSSDVPRSGPIVLWSATAAVATGAAGLGLHSLGLGQLALVAIVLCWLAALIAVPSFVREINARRMVGVNAGKTVADLIVVVVVGSWFISKPSVSGFFGIYVALQAATLVSCAIPMRRTAIALVSTVLLSIGLAQVFIAW